MYYESTLLPEARMSDLIWLWQHVALVGSDIPTGLWYVEILVDPYLNFKDLDLTVNDPGLALI
jgi:hypothetical protein